MLPTILILGLVAGLVLPGRWAWWSIPALGLLWAVLVLTNTDVPSDVPGEVVSTTSAAFGLGAVNAALSVIVGKGTRSLALWAARRIHPRRHADM